VLVVTAWVAAVATLLARRQRGFLAVLSGLMLAQVAFHVAFAVSGGAHPAMGVSSAWTLTSLLEPPMALGHLAAALATSWLLSRGEASAWTLARLLAGRVRTAVRRVCLPAVPSTRPMPPLLPRSLTAEGVLLARACPRRGPPALRSA
jgi:hypothetical protein